MKSLLGLCAALIVSCGFCGQVQAQDGSAPTTRTQQIEDEQATKAKSLVPDAPAPPEKAFAVIGDAVKDVFHSLPLHLQFGGLPIGSGFAMGPVLEWRNSTDRVRGRTWAVGSVFQFYSVGVGLELPRVTSQRLAANVESFHLDSPRLDYYGLGNSSLKSNRTDYRREDTYFNFGLAWPITRNIRPDCSLGQDLIHIGPGTNDSVTPTQDKFGPAQAPGIDQVTNYFRFGCTVPFDFRDNPSFTHKGTAAFVGVHRYDAEATNRFSFNRVSASVEHYIPFLNEKRVIALSAATELSYHGSSQVVPFYMQPTLGGPNDLRGFRARRFYDENSVWFNGEYRWEVCTGLDMALFADAGRVFNRPWEISLSNLQTSAGFGFRINDIQNSIIRLDTGFSREGVQVWFVFNKVF